MALIKEITLDNGITVNYHRIASVNNVTNQTSIIEIQSYTSKEKRLEEKEKLSFEKPMNVFINTEYLNKEYTQNLNVNSAYEYLKTLDKFYGCTDDI